MHMTSKQAAAKQKPGNIVRGISMINNRFSRVCVCGLTVTSHCTAEAAYDALRRQREAEFKFLNKII